MPRLAPSALRVVLVALVAASAAAQPGPAPAARPNVVFVMSDDHALRTIGAYGDGFHATPNLDRIADEGAVFANAFVGNSICGPSRAAILTGTHGHVNGVTGNGQPWDSTQAVFPRVLQQNGYRTALFGKWHLNSRPADEFDEYTILTGAGKQGFYYNPEVYSPDTGTRTLRALPPGTPSSRRSNTRTWYPRSASSWAALMPPTPPPNTATDRAI